MLDDSTDKEELSTNSVPPKKGIDLDSISDLASARALLLFYHNRIQDFGHYFLFVH